MVSGPFGREGRLRFDHVAQKRNGVIDGGD